MFKRVLFGVLIGIASAGVLSATARPAHAAGLCDPCDTRGFSGYLLASGTSQNLVCSSDPDEIYAQCGW